jgi:hypothetical protein
MYIMRGYSAVGSVQRQDKALKVMRPLVIITVNYYTFIVMDKSIFILAKSDRRNSSYVPGSMSGRIALVWPLTCEAVSLSKKYDVERRLQRHITRLIRQKG